MKKRTNIFIHPNQKRLMKHWSKELTGKESVSHFACACTNVVLSMIGCKPEIYMGIHDEYAFNALKKVCMSHIV